MDNLKFDWNDITIVPAAISDIESRSEVNIYYKGGKLPLVVSPMDTVVDMENYDKFLERGFEVCIPRTEDTNSVWKNEDVDKYFISVSISEFEDIISINQNPPQKLLVDVANGHMKKLLDLSKEYKEKFPDKELMIGNIANSETFREYGKIGVDYVRCGIGGGSACTTSANTSVHYPMGSLVEECAKIKRSKGYDTKIVADGGFRNFSDIIKALAVGANYIMLGGILNKTLESCTPKYILEKDNYIEITNNKAEKLLKEGEIIFSYYRGMSTKEVQKKWGKKKLTTSEGITKYSKVEYTLSGWTENFRDYLKSAMSYCGKRNLVEFIGKAEYVHMTQNAFIRFNK